MNTGEPGSVLSVHGLSKSYGDVKAVKNLSFDVVRGEIFGFLGPNGAGKTTTILMLCGLLKKDTGEIRVNGCPVESSGSGIHKKFKQRFGLCPQDIVTWEDLTCLEQVELVGRLYDMKGKAAGKKSLELLDVLGLGEKKDKLAKTLSGGMKRRLNIALALVHDPEILILDEPQAGLDPQSRLLVREYIRSLAGNITVILTTHDMNEADLLSDRVAIIDHGELLVLDTPQNLKNRVGHGEVLEIKLRDTDSSQDRVDRLLKKLPGDLQGTVHEGNILHLVGMNYVDTLPALLERCKDENLVIEDITIRKKTLEDVFIGLTGRRLRE